MNHTTLLFYLLCLKTISSMPTVEVGQRTLVKGMLKYETFYGAPGFGEDTLVDNREPTFILHLNRPILFRDTTLCGSDILSVCPYDTIKQIQVLTGAQRVERTKDLSYLANREVTIECTLFGAHNGHHHAPALTETIFSIKESP